LTPSPIRKVLSTFRTHRVRALLMGGQACIVYGAAEFSRDVDFVVLCDPANLDRLRRALNELQATPLYVPALDADYLSGGHAFHFRCQHEDLKGFRIDIMSVLRGCDEFEHLWERRKTILSQELGTVHLISLPDLVQAKKTQCDKDWPMIRRLVESDYTRHGAGRVPRWRVEFWLREARTPEVLLALARRFPATAQRLQQKRSLLRWAKEGNLPRLERELVKEETRQREADREYWRPLREELERLRRSRANQ